MCVYMFVCCGLCRKGRTVKEGVRKEGGDGSEDATRVVHLFLFYFISKVGGRESS